MTSEFLSTHITEPKFTLVNLGAYPAVIDRGTTAIHGELYRISESTFSSLDKLEGYPEYYSRILIPTEYCDAWMYTLAKAGSSYPVIESGIWI